jgi:hypothetical protein
MGDHFDYGVEKILVQNGAKLCDLPQNGAKARDGGVPPSKSLTGMQFDEAGFLHGVVMQKPAKTCKMAQTLQNQCSINR